MLRHVQRVVMLKHVFFFIGAVLALAAAALSVPFYASTIARDKANTVPANHAPALFVAIPGALRNISRADAQLDFASLSSDERKHLAQLSSLAIRIDPMSPVPLRLMGQLTAAGGDTMRSRDLVLAGDRLNHRDRQANLWLIDYYLKAGNLETGMRYFDQLLRTLGDNRGSVVALLTELLSDPRAVPPLERILRDQPNWSDQFWLFVPGNQRALANAADLRVRLDDYMRADDRKSDGALIVALAENGHYEAGYRVASRVSSDLKPFGVHNAQFTASSNIAPYDWQPTGSNAFAVNVNTRRGLLEISSSPGSSGDVIRQLVRLKPGRYRPVVQLAADQQPQSLPELELSLQCVSSDEGRSIFSRDPSSGEQSVTSVVLDAQCEWYWLTLSSNYAISAYDLALDQINLVPLTQ